MSRRGRVILNVIALQGGWFACVLGAVAGRPWIGPTFVAVHLLFHCGLSPNRARDIAVVIVAGCIGIVADGILLRAGCIAFDAGVISGWIIPIWMIALWMNFATSLNLTLKFLHGHNLLGAAFGAVGGAAAYAAGVRIGALTMPAGTWEGTLAVATEWAVAIPLLVAMAARLDRSPRRRNAGTAGVEARAS